MSDLADVIDADLLPPRLQDFVRLIGVGATLDLVRVYGGLRISLPTPERVTIDHPMVRIIGMDALIELAKYYGAEPHFALPKAERALLAIRNQRIAQAYTTHKTARELAAEHRLTERQVEKILAAMGTTAPVDRRQSTLF